MPFDEECCIKKGNETAFCDEIDRLREKYHGKIEIFKGVEKDYFSDTADSGCDYVIGSVHYIKIGGEYFSVDESAEKFKALAEKQVRAAIIMLWQRNIFKLVSHVVGKTEPISSGILTLYQNSMRAEDFLMKTMTGTKNARTVRSKILCNTAFHLR